MINILNFLRLFSMNKNSNKILKILFCSLYSIFALNQKMEQNQKFLNSWWIEKDYKSNILLLVFIIIWIINYLCSNKNNVNEFIIIFELYKNINQSGDWIEAFLIIFI